MGVEEYILLSVLLLVKMDQDGSLHLAVVVLVMHVSWEYDLARVLAVHGDGAPGKMFE